MTSPKVMQEGDSVNPLSNWTPEQGVMSQSNDAQVKLAAAKAQMEAENKVKTARADRQYDSDLKIIALQHAVTRSGAPTTAKDVIVDAKLFYKFLSGQEQTTL